MAGCDGDAMSSQGEGVCQGKKYGGVVPKKPLISMNHERAYFDSADWVLGKQGTSPKDKNVTETLKPKLKRTPHHQLPPRKPTCINGGDDRD